MPIAVTCARPGTTARVQRPIPPPPHRSEVRDAVLVIHF
jgi:hypothetical protein